MVLSCSLPNTHIIYSTTVNEISTSRHLELSGVNLLDIHNLPYACCMIIAVFIGTVLKMYQHVFPRPQSFSQVSVVPLWRYTQTRSKLQRENLGTRFWTTWTPKATMLSMSSPLRSVTLASGLWLCTLCTTKIFASSVAPFNFNVLWLWNFIQRLILTQDQICLWMFSHTSF